MLEALKKAVCQANLELVRQGLVIQTWGNVSGIDRDRGLVVIKPSGLDYAGMKPAHMVVVSLESGSVVQGKLRPSSDTPTHLALYRAWPTVGGIAHTHSLYATAWAQARRDIPPLGTTHADFAHGPIPCTRPLSDAEIRGDYETNTGKVILERLGGLDPTHLPAVLVAEHGPFAWGADAAQAAVNAIILEQIARMASEAIHINPRSRPIRTLLLDKHFHRKHGPDAYYGQPSKSQVRNPATKACSRQ
jgi:L-ribulose-5-phosphate 4-epimerase